MRKRILYVEDDPVNALVMQKLLRTDYEVIHVYDGESCVEMCVTESFDIVLMDINLGKDKMDGVETMKQLKQNLHAPILAVTSYAMPEDEHRFLHLGFDGYVAKPVERKELLEYILRFLP